MEDNSNSESNKTGNPPGPTTSVPDLQTPLMNPDGTVGHFGSRPRIKPVDTNLQSESPCKDTTRPPALQTPVDNQRKADSYTSTMLDPFIIPQALQNAIEKAVNAAVREAMVHIQNDAVKIMEDVFKRMADKENDKAADFKKWLDNRFAGMYNRIEKNEELVRSGGKDREQMQESSEDRASSVAAEGGTPTPREGDTPGSMKPKLGKRGSLVQLLGTIGRKKRED